jgi:hypothetical protein
MELYFNYFWIWIVTLPLVLLRVWWPIIDYLYWTVFVLATLNLIFVREQKTYSNTRSSYNHYQFYSRVNILNLGLAVFLAVASLIAVFIPGVKVIPLAILWLLAAIVLRLYIAQWTKSLNQFLIVNYIQQKLPDITQQQIARAVELLICDIDVTEMASRAKMSPAQAAEVNHYFQAYLSNQK